MQALTINPPTKNVAILPQLQLIFLVHKLQQWPAKQKQIPKQR